MTDLAGIASLSRYVDLAVCFFFCHLSRHGGVVYSAVSWLRSCLPHGGKCGTLTINDGERSGVYYRGDARRACGIGQPGIRRTQAIDLVFHRDKIIDLLWGGEGRAASE